MEAAQRLARLLGRHVGYGAGVEDTQVRPGRRGDDLVALVGQLACQGIDFAPVQLAAQTTEVNAHGTLATHCTTGRGGL